MCVGRDDGHPPVSGFIDSNTVNSYFLHCGNGVGGGGGGYFCVGCDFAYEVLLYIIFVNGISVMHRWCHG